MKKIGLEGSIGMESPMIYEEQKLPNAGDTVLVGMSGGIDSTLTALLLKERGCRVIGVTMSLWDSRFPKISSTKEHCFDANESESIEKCRSFCQSQGVEYHVVDLHNEYRENVLEYFKAEYRAGRTPNPCIRCNATMKFSAMLASIQKLGIDYDYFCTGHYAKLVRPQMGLYGSDIQPYMIAQASDSSKDQSYFLYRISSSVLEKVRFPLANLSKKEVFELARKAGFLSDEYIESQDFIDPQYFDFLFSDKPFAEGDIVDLDGKVLGRHKGIEHYTVGQRKGLGVAVSRPVYVHSIDAEHNRVVLAPIEDLQVKRFVADDFVWAGDVEPTNALEVSVKIRLASGLHHAIIERYTALPNEKFIGTPWQITLENPQTAVAPGQSAVLYDNGVVLGGGVITKVEH